MFRVGSRYYKRKQSGPKKNLEKKSTRNELKHYVNKTFLYLILRHFFGYTFPACQLQQPTFCQYTFLLCLLCRCFVGTPDDIPHTYFFFILLIYRDKSAINRQLSIQLIPCIVYKRPTLSRIKTMDSRQQNFFQITYRDVYESR